jgi:hypothetical protein
MNVDWQKWRDAAKPQRRDIRIACDRFLKPASKPEIPKGTPFATVNTSSKPWKITLIEPEKSE